MNCRMAPCYLGGPAVVVHIGDPVFLARAAHDAHGAQHEMDGGKGGGKKDPCSLALRGRYSQPLR